MEEYDTDFALPGISVDTSRNGDEDVIVKCTDDIEEKLKIIRSNSYTGNISSTLRKKFREELVNECNSFIAELNTEINEVVNDTKKENGYTTQQSAIGRAMLKRKTDELKKFWELKYKESKSSKEEETLETRELDSGKFLDINRKLENLEKLISHGRGGRGRGTRYRGNRNFPY
ncbi:unnamed protein product [Mytilus coruscus]|uniref:Uncharacterized protein n=1 Tax=Mytilus coruscus TaxID=42192 RepID=A0A6J8ADM8_MYTCO|nr:unnamed protein product [Mytilus coruscus]